MSFHKICVYPEQVLARKADEITNIDGQVHKLATDMVETMYTASGIGLAAPQIGVSQRLIVADMRKEGDGELITLINPVIVSGEGHNAIDEGCLSVPEFTAEVPRQAEILVRGVTLDEKEIEFTANGILAIVLQHEIDHLNGILFIDRISSLKRDIFLRKLKKGKLQQS
ncbi:MAG TPA: peptide deformylase [Proteobacteria bacterium]|jgi:peptide deformylase|nr:MAG: peptide deformylase [Deltaproteobacteria bacterium]HDJ28702.1 peptide deformylase [Pseudomonadota bacterium]